MKKIMSAGLAGVLMLALVAGCSKGYVSQKTTEGASITLKADKYPLIKGDNTLTVSVADASGKALEGASVNVRYYMPPMPGMAPMEYTTAAVAKGSDYSFTANVPMEGGWKVDVTATVPGKPAASATFNLDAR